MLDVFGFSAANEDAGLSRGFALVQSCFGDNWGEPQRARSFYCGAMSLAQLLKPSAFRLFCLCVGLQDGNRYPGANRRGDAASGFYVYIGVMCVTVLPSRVTLESG